MKNGKFFTKQILYNNNAMKVFSLIAAIIFWFIVVINVSPDYNHTISGVKVNIDKNSTVLTSLGLCVIEKSSDSADVVVAGPRNLIGKLSGSDFSITPSLSDVSKAGSYNFQLSAVLKSPDSRIRVIKVSPSNVSVKFDRLVAKNLPVSVKVNSNDIPQGYLMQTAQVYPTAITVTGPLSEVKDISKVVTRVSIGNNVTGTISANNVVTPVDSKGRQCTLIHAKLSSSTVDVTVPILKTRTVPLKVNFTNVPKGVDSTVADCVITPKSVTIAGNDNRINTVSEILLGNIDFTKLSILTNKTYTIPGLDGIMNVQNVTSAKVSIKLKNISKRIMSTSAFTVINQPSGYRVANRTTKITGINLYGPSSGIAKVAGVTAVINMSGVQSGTGQREVPLSFTVPGEKGYWVSGTYKAVVNVSKS